MEVHNLDNWPCACHSGDKRYYHILWENQHGGKYRYFCRNCGAGLDVTKLARDSWQNKVVRAWPPGTFRTFYNDAIPAENRITQR